MWTLRVSGELSFFIQYFTIIGLKSVLTVHINLVLTLSP